MGDAGLAHEPGGGVLIGEEGAHGLVGVAVHHQLGLVALIGDGQLHPLIAGQVAVEHILVQLTGEAQLPGIAVGNGLDGVLAVGGVSLQNDLLAGVRSAVLVHPHGHGVLGAHGVQAGGGKGVLAAQHQSAVSQGGFGAQSQVAAVAGAVLGVGEGVLDVGIGAVSQVDGVIGVGVGSGAQGSHVGLHGGVVTVQAVAANTPHLGAQVGQSIGKAGIDVGLIDAGSPGVDVVVPDGVAGAQHLGGAGGDHGAAHVLRLPAVVQALGVQPVAVAALVASAVGYHVQGAVDGVDQAEAQVEHILGFGPGGVPDVHLSALDVIGGEGMFGTVAAHLGQAAPDPDLTVFLIPDVVDHLDEEVTISGVAVVELVGADVHDGVLVEDTIVDVLVVDLLDDVNAVLLADVHVVEPGTVAALLVQHQIRAIQGVLDVVGDGQSVGGHVQLRDDVHTQGTGVGHEVLELGLGVVVVLGGQAILGVLQTVALVRVPGLGFLTSGHIVLHEDEVVAEVHVEAVHLVPGHGLGDGLEGLHGGGLTAHVQHEAAVLKLGVVPGGALGNGQVAGQLQSLEHRAGAPVGADGVVGLDDHLVGDHHVVGLLVEASLIEVHQADVAGLGRAGDDGQVQAEQVTDISLQLLGHGGVLLVSQNAGVGGEGEHLTLLSSGGVPLSQLRHHGGLGVALVGGVFAGDGQLHSGGTGHGGVSRLPHSDGDLHLGIHQGGVDGAGGIHHLLIVAAPGGGVLLGHIAGHDHLAALDLDALGQVSGSNGGGDHPLGCLLIDLKLVHGHVVPGGAGGLDPHPDIAGMHDAVKVYGLDGGGGGNQFAIKALLCGPVAAVHGGLHVPFVGVVVLPVEDDAAHIVGGAQVVGDGGVLHVRIGGPTGGRGGFVAVPSLVSGEGGAALHVGGGGDHVVLTGDVGALGQGHHLVVGVDGVGGHVAVHLKLPHTHVVPVGHRGAVLGHPQTHILGGDRSIQRVLGLPSGVVGDAHLGGPGRAVSGGLDVVGLDVGLFPEHLEPSDGALLAQVQLEPALGGALAIVAGPPAGGCVGIAINGLIRCEGVAVGVGGFCGDTVQGGQVADDLFGAVDLKLIHGDVIPGAFGGAVLGHIQTHIPSLHRVGERVLHGGCVRSVVCGGIYILPSGSVIGNLDRIRLGVGLFPEHLEPGDGTGCAQVILEPTGGGASIVVVGGPAGRLGAGVSILGLIGVVVVASSAFVIAGGSDNTFQGGQVSGLGLGLGAGLCIGLGGCFRQTVSRCHDPTGEHGSSQQGRQPPLVGFLHTFTPLPFLLYRSFGNGLWLSLGWIKGKPYAHCSPCAGSTALYIQRQQHIWLCLIQQ